MFFGFLVVLIALIAALLILVVLLQSGQGGGLAGIASGGATRQVLGSRQAPDVLEKATWFLASILIALCVLSNFFIGTDQPEESIIQQRAQQGQTQQQAPSNLPPADQGAEPLPGGGQGGGN